MSSNSSSRREIEIAAAKEWALNTGWKCPTNPLRLRELRDADEDIVMLDAYRIARQHSKQILTLAKKAATEKEITEIEKAIAELQAKLLTLKSV